MLLKDEIEMIFSFRSSVDATEYLESVFINQQFSIGDKKSRVFFRISRIEKLPPEEIRDKMRLRTISPLLVCKKSEDIEKPSQPLEPGDEAYAETFLNDLLINYRRKDKNFSEENILQNASFKLLDEPEERIVLMKAGTPDEKKIKAFQMEFELEANAALIEHGFDAGFGEMNKKGFGCVGIIEQEENNLLYGL